MLQESLAGTLQPSDENSGIEEPIAGGVGQVVEAGVIASPPPPPPIPPLPPPSPLSPWPAFPPYTPRARFGRQLSNTESAPMSTAEIATPVNGDGGMLNRRLSEAAVVAPSTMDASLLDPATISPDSDKVRAAAASPLPLVTLLRAAPPSPDTAPRARSCSALYLSSRIPLFR